MYTHLNHIPGKGQGGYQYSRGCPKSSMLNYKRKLAKTPGKHAVAIRTCVMIKMIEIFGRDGQEKLYAFVRSVRTEGGDNLLQVWSSSTRQNLRQKEKQYWNILSRSMTHEYSKEIGYQQVTARSRLTALYPISKVRNPVNSKSSKPRSLLLALSSNRHQQLPPRRPSPPHG